MTDENGVGSLEYAWQTVGVTYFYVFMFVLIICSLFEVGLLVYAYFNADKVECNLLWCTFTDYGDEMTIQNSYSNVSTSITSTSSCSINGVEVNCSEVEKELERWN